MSELEQLRAENAILKKQLQAAQDFITGATTDYEHLNLEKLREDVEKLQDAEDVPF